MDFIKGNATLRVSRDMGRYNQRVILLGPVRVTPMHQPTGGVANTLCFGWSGMISYGKEYVTAALICKFLIIVVFCMLDPLRFYALPESMLIPMLCGAEHLLFVGIKFFLYRGLV
ncbi:hypothetical protein G4B88_000656 [Cannabis sativa]|uniref:NADH-ubiquinone oxidoreductase chain 4 n=1 Tax=Cannabis sativa TaxID=3483 RepID=A0A7J6HGF8_CANSA|nr:hypothetical protein G4B88_000656 [Cannabis sativa]